MAREVIVRREIKSETNKKRYLPVGTIGTVTSIFPQGAFVKFGKTEWWISEKSFCNGSVEEYNG